MTSTPHTRLTAHQYLCDLFGDDAWQYDLDGIALELRQLSGHWNLALLNDPDVETPGIDFWATVAAHSESAQAADALNRYLASLLDLQPHGIPQDGDTPRDRGE